MRKRLHRRWMREGDGLLDVLQNFDTSDGFWTNRFGDWYVARYGEAAEDEPRWIRPISHFVCWVDGWRLTLSARPRRQR